MINNLLPLEQFDNFRLVKVHQQMARLIGVLNKRGVPEEYAEEINILVTNLNTSVENTKVKGYIRLLRKTRNRVLRLIQEKLNWVPKDYYRNQWMAMGMSVFGIPLGVAMGTALDNMGLMGMFFPLGMILGIAIGSALDKKAAEEGRVIDY